MPLTDLEQLPQHFISTANLFNLPLGYQYGVGSAGFGAWRELATHIMTINWVITGECANFPTMYHWRILPSSPVDININYWGKGFATEGVKASLEYGFKQCGLIEIVSITVPANVRSLRVMEKIELKRYLNGKFAHPKLAA